MSTAVLNLAAILGLATNPQCGAAVPGSEFASRLAAIALHESGGDPLVIGINADRDRGLPATSLRSPTAAAAAVQARALLEQGRSLDLGLMQINTAQLTRHGLTVEAAFDACRSMAAGADHYADDVRAVWTLAHRRYNTGSTERGSAYATSVEQVLARVKLQQAQPGAPAIQDDVVAPQPRRLPPGLEDALHATPPVPDASDGLSDALHPPKAKEDAP